MDNITIVKILDDIFEDVYEIKWTTSNTYVLKVDVHQTEKDVCKYLCEIYKCSVNNLTPKIISYYHKHKKSLIVFENYSSYKSLLNYFGTISLKSKKDYFAILDLMIAIYKKIFIMNFILGVYHGDISTLNIILDDDANPYFINFSFNDHTNSNIFIDLISLNKYFVDDLVEEHVFFSWVNIVLCQHIIDIAHIFLKKPPTISHLDEIFNAVREQSIKILENIDCYFP